MDNNVLSEYELVDNDGNVLYEGDKLTEVRSEARWNKKIAKEDNKELTFFIIDNNKNECIDCYSSSDNYCY